MKAKQPTTPSDFKRESFKQYLLESKTLSTVRGYLSSLTATSVVGNISNDLYGIRDIFEINDVHQIERVIAYTVKDSNNVSSHSRFSAALRLYLEYIQKQNEKDNR